MTHHHFAIVTIARNRYASRCVCACGAERTVTHDGEWGDCAYTAWRVPVMLRVARWVRGWWG